MRGKDHIREAAQHGKFAVLQRIAHMVKVEQAVLIFHNVQAGCADLAAFQPVYQRFRVNQGAAGGVDQHNAVFHLGNSVGIDHMAVGGGGVGVQGDDITALVQGIQVHILGILAGFIVGVQVVSQQLATKAAQVAQHSAANVAGADHTHRHTGDVAAHLAA